MNKEQTKDIENIIKSLFENQHINIVNRLSRKYRDQALHNVEDVVQEAFEEAWVNWTVKGVPTHPSAWLQTVANNKLLNRIKRQNRLQNIVLNQPTDFRAEPEYELENQDILLNVLIHIARSNNSLHKKLILALHFVCDFNYNEIAAALLVNTEAVKKTVQRSYLFEKLKSIDQVNCTKIERDDHIEILLKIVYLMFNQGYKSANKNETIKHDLCFEAIRLTQLVLKFKSKHTAVYALLALQFFHISRFPARIKEGAWVPLEKQNRTLWRQDFIQQGFYYLQKVDRDKTALNSYYLQALISAMHCSAKTYEQTDWETIVVLYSELERMHPQSLLIKLNSIIAQTNQKPSSQHIDEILLLEQQVTQANIFIYTMTKAYLYMKNKDYELSKLNYEIALQQTKNQADIKYIEQQLRAIRFNDVDVID